MKIEIEKRQQIMGDVPKEPEYLVTLTRKFKSLLRQDQVSCFLFRQEEMRALKDCLNQADL